MKPIDTPPNRLLVSCWVVSILSFVLTAPFALLAAAFSTDNMHDALEPWMCLAAPFIFLLIPTIAQITDRRGHHHAAKWMSSAAIALCVLAFVYLGKAFVDGMNAAKQPPVAPAIR